MKELLTDAVGAPVSVGDGVAVYVFVAVNAAVRVALWLATVGLNVGMIVPVDVAALRGVALAVAVDVARTVVVGAVRESLPPHPNRSITAATASAAYPPTVPMR